jgi:hypothetical protein
MLVDKVLFVCVWLTKSTYDEVACGCNLPAEFVCAPKHPDSQAPDRYAASILTPAISYAAPVLAACPGTASKEL